jgi:hypothetical protein
VTVEIHCGYQHQANVCCVFYNLERLPRYERAADMVVETTGLTVEEVCQQVRAAIESTTRRSEK